MVLNCATNTTHWPTIMIVPGGTVDDKKEDCVSLIAAAVNAQ